MIPLRDGTEIPQLGLGTFLVPDEDAQRVVTDALEMGYRHIDTARRYDNEQGVGRAIRESGIPRDEIYVTTKVWNDDHGGDKPRAAIEKSLERLGLDYVNLYLIHWPVPKQGLALETWERLIELRDEGLTRSIGVCNFLDEQMEELLRESDEVPVVDQIEQHPWLQQSKLRELLDANDIRTEAWAPLAQGDKALFAEAPIRDAAEAHERTPAQVVLRWHLQRGSIVFPKSSSRERMLENFQSLDFELTADEVTAIDGLDRGEAGRTSADPRTHG